LHHIQVAPGSRRHTYAFGPDKPKGQKQQTNNKQEAKKG